MPTVISGTTGVSQVQDGIITSNKIVDGTITNADINVTAAIIGSKIAANTITTTQLSAGAITQDRLSTGTAGTGPAFSATTSVATTLIAPNTPKKAILSVETFDTNNNFVPGSGATESRFTPTVAGYYLFNFAVVMETGGLQLQGVLYKNGSSTTVGGAFTTSTDMYVGTGSGLVFLNGTGDYIELFILHQSNTTKNSSAFGTRLDGVLVRGA